MSFAIAIMAAGKGTRLKSSRPKVLHEIGGKPLLRHVIDAALKVVPSTDIYVIVGHRAERVKAAVAPTGVRFVEQTEQRGTGHAIQAAQAAVSGYDSLLVLSGDVPLLRTETILAVRDFHLAQRAAMTILTAAPATPAGYGRVLRLQPGAPEVSAIVEQKALTSEQESVREINSGIYAFQTGPLFTHLSKLEANNAHAELYLTDMARLLVDAGERVVAIEAPQPSEVLGANTIAEMMQLDAALRLSTAERLMASGVTIFRPETSTIDAGVTVGPDTIIEPYVQLLGHTTVGANCRIRSYSVIENSTLGDGVLIRPGCMLEDSKVGSGAILGPYAHLRPQADIGEDAHIGNFVEVKNVRFGKGSKANHLSYLGDATVGSGVNIGAGTIFCNYDGVAKHHTEIGDGVFVGSDSVLVAPIAVGEGAYIAAASCITDEVPAKALAFGRARQVNKENWVSNRRAQAAGSKEPGS